MIHRVPTRPAYHLSRFQVVNKALVQLGPRALFQYACYQLGLRSGWYRWRCGPRLARSIREPLRQRPEVRLASGLFPLPTAAELRAVLGDEGESALLSEASEILEGKVRLFGAEPVPLELAPAAPLRHWTDYVPHPEVGRDIKLSWEPARCGWAIVLARAYRLSGDERYVAAFWQKAQAWLAANPPYDGPNWASAQEVALRLISLVCAYQIFAAAPENTPERAAALSEAIAVHAARLPLTLSYARAQNNNHLLSEAAGLLTAGLVLPQHPRATEWRALGWRWFCRGVLEQIDDDGAYIQHSVSYQRLALQLGLWVQALLQWTGRAEKRLPNSLPRSALERLASAARWLLELCDHSSGRMPNLGPNDGALILPLAACPIADYRPVLQAASAEFLNERPFEAGPWDEALAWLGLHSTAHVGQAVSLPAPPVGQAVSLPTPPIGHVVSLPIPPVGHAVNLHTARTPFTLRSADGRSWAYLRAVHFSSRPGHSDQLHLDLWWRGLNMAQDAGSYLYNGQPPWNNPFSESEFHNTLTVDGQGQMARAGRFLFLDWAQARLLSRTECTLEAEHDGYRHLGLIHRRRVSVSDSGAWQVGDWLLPLAGARPTVRRACLHWLLPDWPWSVMDEEPLDNKARGMALSLESPLGALQISLRGGQGDLQIARAGQLVHGRGAVKPTWGWSSPTYSVKIPALSVRLTQVAVPPMSFNTQITLPD